MRRELARLDIMYLCVPANYSQPILLTLLDDLRKKVDLLPRTKSDAIAKALNRAV